MPHKKIVQWNTSMTTTPFIQRKRNKAKLEVRGVWNYTNPLPKTKTLKFNIPSLLKKKKSKIKIVALLMLLD